MLFVSVKYNALETYLFATKLILSFTSNVLTDVKFHSKQGEIINQTKQNLLDCREITSGLSTVLIYF